VTSLLGPLAVVLVLHGAPAAVAPPIRASEAQTFASPTVGPLLRMLAGVGIVCAAASGLAYWARRRRVALGGTNATIQVMAARSLGPRHRLAVVEVGGRTLLLGVGGDGINLLADLTDPIAFGEALHERLPPRSAEESFGGLETPHA